MGKSGREGEESERQRKGGTRERETDRGRMGESGARDRECLVTVNITFSTLFLVHSSANSTSSVTPIIQSSGNWKDQEGQSAINALQK